MGFAALKVGELARRTGLTVRALHHYDEIGLVRPSLHTGAGHRLYTEPDIARLQQVLSLRQLGFSLDEARDCLNAPDFSPTAVLALHRDRLRAEIASRQALADRLEAVETRLRRAGDVSADDFLHTIREITLMESLYTPEQVKQFQEVGQRVGPDEIRQVEEGWTALLADVRANLDLDPASPEAQDLGRRWGELTERTLKGFREFPGLPEAIGENYRQGRFEGHDRAPQAADFAFIERVKAARPPAGP